MEKRNFVRRALYSGRTQTHRQGAAGSGSVPQRLHPPDEAVKRMGPYRARGNGDLRQERNRLFVELVAAAFVCKNQWSRTPGVVEGYVGLLQLCKFFGVQ